MPWWGYALIGAAALTALFVLGIVIRGTASDRKGRPGLRKELGIKEVYAEE